jgi:hypothetical protein
VRRHSDRIGRVVLVATSTGMTSIPGNLDAVLILAADDDPIIPLVNARIMVRLLPNATLEIVPRGGPLFLLTAAETVAPRIGAFLAAG